MYKTSSKHLTDSSCAGPSPILQLSFQWFIQSLKSAPEAVCPIKYLVWQKKNLTTDFLWVLCIKRAVKTSEELVSDRNLYGVRFCWLLRIMFIVMPGCHPWLLFQIFPFTIPRVYSSLFTFDPNSIVTGNLLFIFGTLKKATLWKRQGKQNQYFLAERGYLKVLRECKEVDETSNAIVHFHRREPRCSESIKRCRKPSAFLYTVRKHVLTPVY